MSQSSALDDDMPSSSSTLPCDLIQEIARGVQDERLVRTPAEVALEVRLRLDRLLRAWDMAKGQRTT